MIDPRDLIHDHYGLLAKEVTLPKEETVSSAVVIIDCGERGRYVLKRSEWYSGFADDPRKALQRVSEVHNMLRAAGVPLPEIHMNEKSSFVTEDDGALFVLMDFVDGDQITGSLFGFAEAGKALAGFHAAGARLLERFPTLKGDILRDVPVEMPYAESAELYRNGLRDRIIGEHSCSHPTVCAAVRGNIAAIDSALGEVTARLSDATPHEGILHNDFNYANGLYHKDGRIVAFLDTEQLGIGPFVFDVANTLASFFSKFKERTSLEEYRKRTAAFLRAYHAVNPLPTEDYILILPSTQRWDLMRILRTLRRHHDEDDRLSGLVPKIEERLLQRLIDAPRIFSFIDEPWLSQNLA